jgi:hypothetical protein
MKNWLILAILAIVVTSSSLAPLFRNSPTIKAPYQTSPGPDGLLYINPVNIPELPMGAEFNVTVQASGVSYFDYWDVWVSANPSIITAVSMSIVNDYFFANATAPSPPTVFAECINGVTVVVNCEPNTANGIAELAGGFVTGVPTLTQPLPINGPLLNITYKVVGSGTTAQMNFNSQTQLLNEQPGKNPVQLTVSFQNGLYGTIVPDFGVSINPSFPSVEQGFTSNTTIELNSIDGFSGTVAINITGPKPGPIPAFNFTTLVLKSNSTISTLWSFSAPISLPIQLYSNFTLIATSGSIVHEISFSVSVGSAATFVLQFIPPQLNIHAGLTGNATLLVLSTFGFHGLVNLTIIQPQVSGLVAQLGSTSVNLTPNSESTTLVFVTTPPDAVPFNYKINVTGTGLWNGVTINTIPCTLTVKPPSVSMLVSLTPASITVRAGGSGSAIINVASVDYFWGYMSVSAVMSGGAVTFVAQTNGYSGYYYIPPTGSSNASIIPSINIGMTVSVTTSTPPGNYVALLTVYSLKTLYQSAYSIQVPVQVSVQAPVAHAANTVFGLPSPVYFGILGALAIPLIILSVLTYKRREKEDTSWRN